MKVSHSYIKNILDPVNPVSPEIADAFQQDLKNSYASQIHSIFARQTSIQEYRHSLSHWRPHFMRQLGSRHLINCFIQRTDFCRDLFVQYGAQFLHLLGMRRAAYTCILTSAVFSNYIDQSIKQRPHEPIQRAMNQPSLDQASFLASLSRQGLLASTERSTIDFSDPDAISSLILIGSLSIVIDYLPMPSQWKEHLQESLLWSPAGMSGICQGMSLSFLHLYSEALSQKIPGSSQEIVTKIARSFASGGNAESIFLQFISDNHKEIFNHLPLQIHVHSTTILGPEPVRHASSEPLHVKETLSYGNALASLDTGMYLSIIPGSSPRIHHAIAVIKISPMETYIFDPNQGLIACPGDNPDQIFTQYMRDRLSKSLIKHFEQARNETKERRITLHNTVLEPEHCALFYIQFIPCSDRTDNKVFPDRVSNRFLQDPGKFFLPGVKPIGPEWSELHHAVYVSNPKKKTI